MAKLSAEQKITNYILENIEGNELPWRQPFNSGITGSIGFPKRNNLQYYRGVNVLILYLTALRRHYVSPSWLTYKQCVEQGGNVKKGECGVSILYVGQKEIENVEPGGDPKSFSFARSYRVFNIEQTENLPDDYILPRVTVEQPTHIIHDYIEATGANILNGHNIAGYFPGMDVIRMPNQSEFIDDDTYAATLAHELIHWTAHPDRANRPHDYDREEERAFEELVAEIGSVMLCTRLNIRSAIDERHIPYIRSWIASLKNNPKYIVRAASQAQKAVSYILDKVAAESGEEVAA